MNQHPPNGDFDAYRQGHAASNIVRDIETHLSDCSPCCAKLIDMIKVELAERQRAADDAVAELLRRAADRTVHHGVTAVLFYFAGALTTISSFTEILAVF